MRRHIAAHWRIWLLIAAVVIVANGLIDRNFFDHREHISGDVLLTILVLLVAVVGSYLVTRARTARLS